MSKQIWKFKPGDKIVGNASERGRKSLGRVITRITEEGDLDEMHTRYKIYWIDISEFRIENREVIESFYERSKS